MKSHFVRCVILICFVTWLIFTEKFITDLLIVATKADATVRMIESQTGRPSLPPGHDWSRIEPADHL